MESTIGTGTSFTVLLPEVVENVEIDTITALPKSLGSETILVVEDEASVRRMAVRALSRRGYEVLVAENGQEGLDVMRRLGGRVDLIVTDVIMPELDGRQMAEAVLAEFPGVRILYASGYTDDAMLRHGIRESELMLLRKPYTIAELANRVRELLDAEESPGFPLVPVPW